MNIGIDVDEVLVEHLDAFLDYHNYTYGTKIQKKDMFSYSFEKVIGETEQDTRKKLLHFFKTDFFHNMKPIAGAREAIALLAKEHQLSAITARPSVLLEQTEQLIATQFPYFSNITLTNQWHGVGKKISKSEVCIEKKITIMVDDSLTHAMDCASRGIHVLLADFGYPWNQTPELPENIKRVHSWKEIVDEVERYGRSNRTRKTKKV